MSDTTLIDARYIVPVRPKGLVLTNHAVIVQDGLIKHVLPRSEALVRFSDARTVDLSNHVVIPGLINMHCHSPMTLLRGCADDMSLNNWLRNHIWPLESRLVSRDFVAEGTELAIAEMIRGGTTMFNDNYFFPGAAAEIAAKTGMRAGIGLPIIDVATSWASGTEECFEKGLKVEAEWEGHPLISFTLAPHAPYSCSNETLSRVAAYSEEKNIPVNLHLLETDWDQEHSQQNYDQKSLERLESLGLINERLIAVHMTKVTGQEIDLIAERGVHVVHCPQSNLKLASGFCPVANLLNAGVNVSVGTDGAASNNSLDMFMEARFTALLCKGVSDDPTAGNATEIMDMLTINAAKAMGLDQLLGTIETGKQADLCAINLQCPESQPVHNVISHLIYAVSRQQVSDVWVAGRRLLKDGELTTIELADIYDNTEKWQKEVSSTISVQTGITSQ